MVAVVVVMMFPLLCRLFSHTAVFKREDWLQEGRGAYFFDGLFNLRQLLFLLLVDYFETSPVIIVVVVVDIIVEECHGAVEGKFLEHKAADRRQKVAKKHGEEAKK
jgi:hypothetical protein